MALRELTVITLFVMLIGPAALAQDGENCDCDQYRSLLGPVSLGTQLQAIGVEALHLEEGSSLSTGSMAEIQDFRRRLREMIPERCHAILRHIELQPGTRIIARVSLEDARGFETSIEDEAGMLRNRYRDFIGMTAYEDCRAEAIAAHGGSRPDEEDIEAHQQYLQTYEACRVRIADERRSEAERDLASGGELFERFTGDLDTPLSPEQTQVLQVFNEALLAGTDEGFVSALEQHRENLTVEQRLLIVQMFLGQAEESYDNDRSGNEIEGGVVDGTEMIETMRHNLGFGNPLVNPDVTESPIRDARRAAGVCRDMHSFGARIGEALGFRHSLVLSYGVNTSTHHSVTLLQDPEDDNQIYIMNYGRMMARRARDSTALFNGRTEAGLNYRLSRPDGRTIDTIPSPMGQFLAEAAGFRTREIEPLARGQRSLIAGDVRLGDSDMRLRAGIGEDRIGARYLFTGTNGAWDDEGNFPGQAGILLGMQDRPGEAYGEGRDMQMGLMYLYIQQNALSPDLELGENTRLRVEGNLTGTGYAAFAPRPGEVDGALDGNLHLQAGLRLENSADDGSHRATVRTYAQGGIGAGDIRDSTAVAPVLHHVALEGELLSRIAGTSAGPLYVIAAGALVIDELGLRGEVEAGIGSDQVAATVRLEGRLTDDTLPVQDGADRRVGASAVINPTENVRVRLQGSASLENAGDFRGGGSLEFRE